MTAIFGLKDHLELGQECARAVLIYLLRPYHAAAEQAAELCPDVGPGPGDLFHCGVQPQPRPYRRRPLPGTLAAVAVLVLLHVLLSHAVARSQTLSRLVEGGSINLLRQGRLDHKARKSHMISMADLAAALRQHGVNGFEGLDNVKTIELEPSGRISVVKHDPCKPVP